MKTSTVNSPLNSFFTLTGIIGQKSNKKNFKNVESQFPLFYQEVHQTLQTYNPLGLDFQITDSKMDDEDILDLQGEKKHENSPDFPSREKRDEVTPNREKPKEDDDTTDDDDIIEEPTRELDDPYKPGHGDRKDIPQTEEDS